LSATRCAFSTTGKAGNGKPPVQQSGSTTTYPRELREPRGILHLNKLGYGLAGEFCDCGKPLKSGRVRAFFPSMLKNRGVSGCCNERRTPDPPFGMFLEWLREGLPEGVVETVHTRRCSMYPSSTPCTVVSWFSSRLSDGIVTSTSYICTRCFPGDSSTRGLLHTVNRLLYSTNTSTSVHPK